MYAQCMRHFSHRHVGIMLGAFEKFLNNPIYTLLTWHILKKKNKKIKNKNYQPGKHITINHILQLNYQPDKHIT